MTKNKIVLALQQEIPALEATAEGQLRGGFSAIGVTARDSVNGNDEVCSNSNCKNSTCTNKNCKNTNCFNNECKNDQCVNTGTPTSSPTSTSSNEGVKSFGGLSLLGF